MDRMKQAKQGIPFKSRLFQASFSFSIAGRFLFCQDKSVFVQKIWPMVQARPAAFCAGKGDFHICSQCVYNFPIDRRPQEWYMYLCKLAL